MTVSAAYAPLEYAGNGATVAFPVTWPFGESSDLLVTAVASDDSETVKTLTTHYTVTRTSTGGTVTAVTAPAPGVTWRIERATPKTQPDQLRLGGSYSPVTVEAMHDRTVRQVQELGEQADRSPHFSPVEQAFDTELPAPVAGAVPMVNDDADGFSWALWGTNPDALATLSTAAGAGLIGFNDTLGTNYLKTVSDIINGDQVSLHRFIDPTKLSAIRASTSTYDASEDVQDGLDVARDTTNGLRLYVPHGTIIARNLLMSGNTSLDGECPASVFKLPEGALTTDKILRNANQATYTDFNLSIRGLTFDGNDAGDGETQTRLSELLSFGRVINLRWTDNIVQNVQYIGLALGGVHRARITNSQFALCGYDGTTENGGPACWISNMATDQSQDIVFSHNQVHTNRWSGLHFSVVRGAISGNAFYDNQEAHIFGSRLAASNIEMSDVAIVGNSFVKIRRRHISSHAIEVGGLRLAITGNTIYDCDHGGIALTDSQHSTVTGNTIGNFNNLSVALGSGVDLICAATGADAVSDITITGNTIYDDRATVLGRAGVHVYNGGGDAPTNITVHGNPMNAAWTSGKGVLVGAGMLGSGFSCRNNPGNDDSARGCSAWQDTNQTIPNATETAIVLDTVQTNSESFVDGEGPMWEVANPTRITAREPGRWRVSGGVGFATNGTGARGVVLKLNGSAVVWQYSTTSPAAIPSRISASSGIVEVVAGDYIELFAYQESGVGLDTEGVKALTWLSVEVL